MTTTAIEVQNLHKSFGEVKAVDGIDFTVQAGEIFSLIGPNGAGKTTTIQMLLGTMSKTSGKLTYFDLDMDKHRSDISGIIDRYADA